MKGYFKILSVGITCFFFVLAGHWLYIQQRERIYIAINDSFQEIIAEDLTIRWEEKRLPFHVYRAPVNSGDSVTIQDHSGTRRVPVIEKKQSENEKYSSILQSVLRQENPINVNRLDSLLLSRLRKQDIFVTTSISYTDKASDTYKSNKDSSFYEVAYATPQIRTGVEQELILQAFAKVTWYTVLRSSGGYFFTWSILSVIFIVILVLLLYQKPKQIVKVSGNELLHHESAVIQITDEVTMNMQELVLQYGEQRIKLTQQIVDLLKLFIAHENHFITYEEMTEALWGKSHDPSDSITQVIRRLRGCLKPIPCLAINNVRGRGYQLTIDGESKPLQKEEQQAENL
ncbi:helix-turn-helix domain-containing protein [Parabacteroides bouchesdurhonensis]|uniref:helix-turn-helix domain-containing protein n=1 Tax=Parabacteroides bouchesdurhonensis TaxID=1936995 RepID=UPI000E4AD3BE|nr:helix-turn-helix domain-containing protein [Parabacteroides bouchesdurhonensis]RHJ93002.1 helix-turn-helix domain-containing protein [Bacteroides sp. AM07-16]